MSVLRPEDKKIIRKEISNAIKTGRTVPYSLRTMIDTGISINRIRKVYRKREPLAESNPHGKTPYVVEARPLARVRQKQRVSKEENIIAMLGIGLLGYVAYLVVKKGSITV